MAANRTDHKEQIRDALPLHTVVALSVDNLTEISQGMWRGSCPIHGGTNPSALSVNSDEGYYHCHNCGAGGDVFDWIMAVNNCDFVEAMEIAADLSGVKLPVAAKGARGQAREVRDVMQIVADHWHDLLDEPLRELLHDTYGLTDETINVMRMGYADGLIEFLKASDVSQELAMGTGLVILDKKNNPVVPLKGRIIFPWLRHGKVAYMSGRRVGTEWDGHPGELEAYKTMAFTDRDEDEPPKYVQQSVRTAKRETVDKSVEKPLWGEDSLTNAAHVLVVEGMPDAFAAWQHRDTLGDGWAIVSSGTCKLRKKDLKIISDRAGLADVVIAYDNDDAGIEGALAAGRLLTARGIAAQVGSVPGGADVDMCDCLRDEGGDVLREVVQSGSQMVAAWCAFLRQQDEPSRIKGLREMLLPMIATLDKTKIDNALEEVSTSLSIPLVQLRKQVEKGKVAEDTDSDVLDVAKGVFNDYYKMIGHMRGEARTDIVAWSKKHGSFVYLPLTAIGKIPGILAPEVDILSAISGATGVSGKESTGLFRQVLMNLAVESEPIGRFDKLKSGMHVLDNNTLVIISGSRIIMKEEGRLWETVDDPFIDKNTVAESGDPEDWLEWSVDELNEPLDDMYKAESIYEKLCMLLADAWKFKFSNDARIIAATCFALTWSSAFPRRSLVHVRGPAGCGKTSLTFGFMGGGSSYKRMGGPFVPTAKREENATYAGITSRYGHSGHTLLLDEGELTSNPKTKHERNAVDVLTALRNAAESGTEVLRGTAEGGWRSSKMSLACVISSISAWEADADVRRWLVIEPEQDKDLQPPTITVAKIVDEWGLDTGEMRRGILLAFQDRIGELKQTYDKLLNGSIEGDNKISPSQRDNALPILSALSMVDDSFEQTAVQFYKDKGTYEVTSQNTKVEHRLLDAILYSPFEEPGSGYMNTVVGFARTDGMRDRTMAMAGVMVRMANVEHKDHIERRKMLLVNLSNAKKQGPLQRTEFAIESDRKLGQIASGHSAFIDTGKRIKVGDVYCRWARFDWEMLIEDMNEGGHDE